MKLVEDYVLDDIESAVIALDKALAWIDNIPAQSRGISLARTKTEEAALWLKQASADLTDTYLPIMRN